MPFHPRRRLFFFSALLAPMALRWSSPTWAMGSAASPEGVWLAPNHKTGEDESLIQVYAQGGKLYGKIVKLIRDPKATCKGCSGANKNRSLKGMTIMWNLVRDDDEWTSGRVMDTSTGKTYRCKIWLEDTNTLKLRAYLGPFYDTSVWKRHKGPI